MRVSLRPSALVDLEEIYSFSLETWGAERAQAYIRKIDEAFQQLARHPRLGQERDEVVPGVRAFRVLSHVIFYRGEPEQVGVIRVLHKAMDFPGRV